MSKTKRTDFFNGNKGKVWIAGEEFGTVSKGKITIKQNYEEIPDPNNPGGVVRVPTYQTKELSITYRPSGAENETDMFNLNEDITVIMANTNISDGKNKRVKCDGVTFDEQTLINFEKHKVEEIELTGQAETFEILE